MVVVKELCSCSARFFYVSISDEKCQIAAMMWREHHIHNLPQIQDEPEQHDSELDAYVEKADHRDVNPAAELDHRTRMGFQWIQNPLKKEGET